MKRVEDVKLLRGNAVFIHDIKLPNMAYCFFVRSPYAHAKINRVDSTEAAKMKGVLTVIDGGVVASKCRPLTTFIEGQEYYGIAVDKVRYVGEPVAIVVADSYENAVDAAEKIEVEYEPLKPVLDPEEALTSSTIIHDKLKSNHVLRHRFVFGDVEKAFAEADLTVKEKFVFERYAASPLETCGVVADYKPDGSLTVYDNQQTPQLFKSQLAASLQIPSPRVRIVEPEIGGGFGVKIMLYPYVLLVAFASMVVGRPVKWVETRREHLTAMAHNSNRVFYAEMALRWNGEVKALRTHFIEDCGAWVRPPDPGGVIRSLMTYMGCYRIKNVEALVDVVVTNKCPTGPVRGYGNQQAYFMLERMMDIAAKKLGISPAEIRMKNIIKPSEQPYRTPFGSIYDGGDYEKTLKTALELADVEKFEGKPFHGVGIACVVEPAVTNLARNRLLFPQLKTSGSGEAAAIRLEEDGSVTVFAACIPQGQGHKTVVTQLIVDMLGVDASRVNVVTGDTLVVPPSPYGGTWASRFSVMTLAAVKKSCEDLRTKIIRFASKLLETTPEDLEIKNGTVMVKDGVAQMTLQQVAQAFYRNHAAVKEQGLTLSSEAFYDFPFFNTGEPGEINMSATYGNSTHVAIVRIDPETFQVEIVRYVAVHDCGKILNKQIVEGQVMGGVLQGISAALFEKIAYDDAGQPLTTSFADYLLPTAVETPQLVVAHTETPSLFSELGAKGMGEGPAIPVAAAIMNAISNAVQKEITSSHLSWSQLWEIVNDKCTKNLG